MAFFRSVVRDYPVTAIALALLACVKFEYQTTTWALVVPGLAGGLVVLAIVAVVLLFRIFNAVQDVCVVWGLIPSRIRCKYDVLIPIGFIAVLPQIRYFGEPFHGGLGKSGYSWDFQWSDRDWNAAFLAALIGVVLLVRILYLLRAIADASGDRCSAKARLPESGSSQANR